MDVIILRTMTLKSQLSFGKYEGMTIHQVLSLKHTRYLRWIYYNMSRISFVDEILAMINIRLEHKIDKPGKNPDKGKEVDNIVFSHAGSDLKRIKAVSNANATKRHDANRNRVRESMRYSRGNMQARNHGH